MTDSRQVPGFALCLLDLRSVCAHSHRTCLSNLSSEIGGPHCRTADGAVNRTWLLKPCGAAKYCRRVLLLALILILFPLFSRCWHQQVCDTCVRCLASHCACLTCGLCVRAPIAHVFQTCRARSEDRIVAQPMALLIAPGC